MAHYAQQLYMNYLAGKFPDFFNGKKVLEVGSLDINGSVRDMFKNCEYTGIDVGEGKGVDIVAEGQKFPGPDNHYDVTISCECFEHNPYWLPTFVNMWRMLRPQGLMIITCAGHGREEHGTHRRDTTANPLSVEKWHNYYRNLSEWDFKAALHLDYFFEWYEFGIDHGHHDLFFFGVKNNRHYWG